MKIGADAGVSKENLLRMQMTLGEFLDEATGKAEQAKYAGKSAKIKYEIENATKQDQINKITSEANFQQYHSLREDLKLQMNKQGYIDGNLIGTTMQTMFGIDNNTPQWKKAAIIAAPAVARFFGPVVYLFVKKWAKGKTKSGGININNIIPK
jgi:hypothetical protein